MNKSMSVWLTTLVLLSVGCATTQLVKVPYTPQDRSPLATLKPSTVVLVVEDQRPADERDSVSPPVGRYRSKTVEPPPLIVFNTLKQEFERNGHRVVTTASPEATVTIRIGLKRFWGIVPGVDKIATIEGEVIAQHAGAAVAPGPISVTGTYKKHYKAFMVITGDVSKELGLALGDFVRNLTLTPEFLEAFK